MSDKATLFTFWRSSCSWRVRIAINLAGVDVEQVPVDLNTDGQLSEEYRKVNPMGQVPAFKTGNFILTQSVAIMEYIHDLYPEVGLLPENPLDKAKVRMVTELICSGIQPLQNTKVREMHSKDKKEELNWSKYWITAGFHALEQLLAEVAGECCVGDRVTIADCCLVPQVDDKL